MIRITKATKQQYLDKLPEMTKEQMEKDYKFLDSFMERTDFEEEVFARLEEELVLMEGD